MPIPTRSLSDITNQALHVLVREMGAADTMRFIGQFSTGAGNCTEERALLFDHLTLGNVLSDIRGTQSDENKV